MTDLINKTVGEVKSIVEKFSPVFPFLKNKNQLELISIIFDISVNHLNDNYPNKSADAKASCMLLIRRLFDLRKIIVDNLPNEEVLKSNIDEYMKHHELYYDKYNKDVSNDLTEFSVYLGFVDEYNKMKKND